MKHGDYRPAKREVFFATDLTPVSPSTPTNLLINGAAVPTVHSAGLYAISRTRAASINELSARYVEHSYNSTGQNNPYYAFVIPPCR
jgi:hypothetical protein